MAKKTKITQMDLIKEFFINHPNKDIEHSKAVAWLVPELKKRNGKGPDGVFADPDRGIRKLSQEGFLIKVSKGVYRYDPKKASIKKLQDFTAAQKKIILKRDGYKCVICGKGKKEGMELHVDHIKAKDLGGEAIIENGQTLCSQHNFLKKNLNQTETGKKMFVRLYELAKANNETALQKFCEDILNVFEKNNINGHIEWPK